MSEHNVEIVRRIYAEWERGNFFETSEFFHPDVHVVWIDPIIVPAGETRGLDELGATMRDFLDTWEDLTATPQKILDAEDEVVCLSVWRARGRASAVPVEYHQANVWTCADGRVTRLVNYGDPAKGLEAAGLSE